MSSKTIHHRRRPPAPVRIVRAVLRPFGRFSRMEAAGGLLLLTCTAVALAWANSPWSESYFHLWETPVTIGAPGLGLTESLHHWINDGLMAVFFFVVGLEIKRELLIGELASPRQAALPIAAALGGMVVPALLYAAFNLGGPGAAGWGIPMATDIAFALGILALLGSRVPIALKVFLAALAIVDDLGAVLVIAFFYTAQISWAALGVGAVALGILVLCNVANVRRASVYALFGVVLWVAFLKSGVHATIAGVLAALTIPARTKINEDEFLERAKHHVDEFERASSPETTVLTNAEQQSALTALEDACEAAQAPLQKLEHELHGWVAFAIMPLFALANAGVRVGGDTLGALSAPVLFGIGAGLVIGKPVGITLASWLAVRSGLAVLPAGAGWRAVHGAAWLGGIGFTMSLFIAGLAFADVREAPLLDSAKVGILGASMLAGVVGYALLRAGGPSAPEAAESADPAPDGAGASAPAAPAAPAAPDGSGATGESGAGPA